MTWRELKEEVEGRAKAAGLPIDEMEISFHLKLNQLAPRLSDLPISFKGPRHFFLPVSGVTFTAKEIVFDEEITP